MKRVGPTLVCLLVLLTVILPTAALATESKTTTAATTATATAGGLIVYPAAPADATAAQAKASTQWQKPGDLMNLIIALLSVVAAFGIVVWGVYASSRIARA